MNWKSSQLLTVIISGSRKEDDDFIPGVGPGFPKKNYYGQIDTFCTLHGF